MKPGQGLIKGCSSTLQPRPAAITKWRWTSHDSSTAAGAGALMPGQVRQPACAICCRVTDPPGTVHPSQQLLPGTILHRGTRAHSRTGHTGSYMKHQQQQTGKANTLICLCKVSCCSSWIPGKAVWAGLAPAGGQVELDCSREAGQETLPWLWTPVLITATPGRQ